MSDAMSYLIQINLLIYGLLCPESNCYEAELLFEQRFHRTKYTQPLFDKVPYPKMDVLPLLNRKIFKGTRVTIRESPFVASIRRNVAHYLIGTVIGQNVLITVAHPLLNVSIAKLSVVVGENYADRGSMLLNVIVVVIHGQFNPYTLEHDVALVRVFESFDRGASAKVNKIPVSQKPNFEGNTAFVFGWGRCDRTGRELCLPRSSLYTEGEALDPMLQSVKYTFNNDDSTCQFYKSNGLPIGPGHECIGAARREHPMTPCMAVPGAPLVVEGNLSAILSWGFGCGHAGDLPLVYITIKYYHDWIVYNTNLFQNIEKATIIPLFYLKRAYVLKEWLRLTRIYDIPPDNYKDKPLYTLPVDRELVRLKGTVYDIRDFLYKGVLRKKKLQMYQKLRNDLGLKEKAKSARKAIIEMYRRRNEMVRPFLTGFNQTIDTDDSTPLSFDDLKNN